MERKKENPNSKMADQSTGPMESPCIKCSKTDNEPTVVCFLCEKLCHIKCNKISKSVFAQCNKNNINDLGYKWICPECIVSQKPNQHNSVNAIMKTTSNN